MNLHRPNATHAAAIPSRGRRRRRPALRARAGWARYAVAGLLLLLTTLGGEPAHAQAAGICGRTAEVQTAILAEIAGVSACADVTSSHLAAITEVAVTDEGLAAVAVGDFAGLTALSILNLSENELTALPAGVFDGLTALQELRLENNELTRLPAGVFATQTALQELQLSNNPGAPFSPTVVALPDEGRVSINGGTEALRGTAAGAWGANVVYSWALTNPPQGVTLANPTSTTPTVTIPALPLGTELTITLSVTGRGFHIPGTDSRGAVPGTNTVRVTVTAARDDYVHRGDLASWAAAAAAAHGGGGLGLPALVPDLVLEPQLADSVEDVVDIATSLEGKIRQYNCSELTDPSPAFTVCNAQDLTGEDLARAITRLYNHDVATYVDEAERAGLDGDAIQLFNGALTQLQLVELFREFQLIGIGPVRKPPIALDRFLRCQHAVATAIDGNGNVGISDENAADIIQNCTDIRRVDGEPTPAQAQNILAHQLAYLAAVDSQVKVIVQQYCDADILRAPGHYDQNPSQVRRVHRVYVEMCQDWFVGDDYAALRARWQASYEADQAWEKRRHAPPRPTVVNGAARVRAGVADRPVTQTDPGDGVVGPNLPPLITTITPHDSKVPGPLTPHDQFDEDGYALVVGGVVHKYTPTGGTERCAFHGYDGSLYYYETCP